MKKITVITLITLVLVSCKTPTEKTSIKPTAIGYEYNDQGVKQEIIAGDLAITDVYMDYIQAHNDKNLEKIHEMDMEDVIIRAADGSLYNGRDSHKKELELWFSAANPTWKVKWMVANTVQGADGKKQHWLTTGVDVVQVIEENIITSHHVVDVNFVDGKIKELNAYDRASEKK
jgi:hypothetical protein